MRKVGDLMKDLGFRNDASDDVKIAFLKNLMRAAYGVNCASPHKPELNQTDEALRRGEQLSFNFDATPEVDPVEGLFPKRKSG